MPTTTYRPATEQETEDYLSGYSTFTARETEHGLEVAETVTVYGTSYIRTRSVREFRAYLYAHTEVVSERNVVDDVGTPITLLVTATTADTAERCAYLQQYQADRLASGMLPLVNGFSTLAAAEAHLDKSARANGAQVSA